jgi:hypothetical protein
MIETNDVDQPPRQPAPPAASVVKGVRRAAIIAIIVSLVAAALLGIVALLSGEFGEVQGKVLLTTLTIAACSVRLVGFLGIAASGGAALCALVLIWADWSTWTDTEGWWKALGVLTVAAVSLAQANLLLLLVGRPQRLIRIALGVTLVALAIVAVMIVVPILTDGEVPGDDGDTYWRVFGVLAILDALGTIALPILGLVLRTASGASAPAAPEGLALQVPPDLAARIDAAAAASGVTPERYALDVLARSVATPSAD